MNELIGRKFPVLDDGFIRVVDLMGSDETIVRAARQSYDEEARTIVDELRLIRYLMRHQHTVPFEHPHISLQVRMPIDVMRQWAKHRTASTSEYSTRYSEAIDSRHKTAPDEWRLQSGTNKQGSSGFVTEWPPERRETMNGSRPCDAGEYLSRREKRLHESSMEIYDERLEFGVAREQARKDLPLSTYTMATWTIDLHNLLHFLKLRMDHHAQLEIRSYADVIGHEIVAKWCPMAWEAFVDYRLSSLTLGRLDVEVVNAIGIGIAAEDALFGIDNKREREECRIKLIRLGIIKES